MAERDLVGMSEARAILGVEATASAVEVKSAYRRKLKTWHPDRVGPNPSSKAEAVRETQRINAAYRLLAADPKAHSGAGGDDSRSERAWKGREIRKIDSRWWPLRAVLGNEVSLRIGVALWMLFIAALAALGWFMETR